MSEAIDWTLCIACQEKTPELGTLLIIHQMSMHKFICLVMKIYFEAAEGKEMEKQAKCQKNCHQKCNNEKLKRARQQEGTAGVTCHPQRRVANRKICRFCIFSLK